MSNRVRRALERGSLTLLEGVTLVLGPLLMVSAVPTAWLSGNPVGVARAMGLAGLAAGAICAASRGIRLYRAGLTASLPISVARVHVRVRPARGFNTAAVAIAVVLPLAVAVTLLVLVEWIWMLLVAVLLLGCAGALASATRRERRELRYAWQSAPHEELLERLCMRADMRTPELVVEHGPVASAWTAGGEIHVTRKLLSLLDDREVEAVLAHEVAHLARRDAAVMEICSAPSRVLLAFARVIVPWTRALAREGFVRTTVAMVVLGVLCGPPALVLGWVSRLSVLGMSRAREFSADAAAATLTGNASALASALMKLDRQREWTPRSDLRQIEAFEVLCIVGTARRRIGRLLSTHPTTAARVRRLEATETRIQAGPYRTLP